MHSWAEHVGELELHVAAPTVPAVFLEAFSAFAELVHDHGFGPPDSEHRTIELEAEERADLLAAWLDELVYLADAHGFVPEHLADLRLDGERLHAIVRGHTGEPSALVKAVTRHGLAFEAVDEGWRAKVVLDV